MAIVQVSRITNRKGLTEDLPQLAGAELGWCLDSRRLFIGNGQLSEGAPVIGNTEILTEFSDIATSSPYTYADTAVGYAAQTGPTAGDPVIRQLTAKLDDIASVRDFGAVGDGEADDTAAINRALFQLYCVESNTQIRRALLFPAGTYRITSPILIPPYARLVGEGQNHTIISLDDSSAEWVVQTSDSRQQVGATFGYNATLPRDIEVASLTFQTLHSTDILQINAAQNCWFSSVGFLGPYSAANIQNPAFDPDGNNDTACVRWASISSTPNSNITFDRCTFQGLARGINSNINGLDAETLGITVTNSRFDTLYQGVGLGLGTSQVGLGPQGFRIVHNMWDSIFAEGVRTGSVDLTVTAHNVFYDVGDSIATGTPSYPVIYFGSDASVSVGDMFQRTDIQNYLEPRILITGTTSNTGSGIQLGGYYRDRGHRVSLVDRFSTQTLCSINTQEARALRMDYTINYGDNLRMGTMTVATSEPDGSSITVTYDDEYTEAGPTFVTLAATQMSLPATATELIVITYYVNTGLGDDPQLTYSIQHLA